MIQKRVKNSKLYKHLHFSYFFAAIKMTSELDTTQFKDTPIIRKLKVDTSQIDEVKGFDEKQREKKEDVKPKSNRGRKRKYNTTEERLAARRLQQKAYRERKKAELVKLKSEVEK